jgi:large subunit ribosomal protein L14e
LRPLFVSSLKHIQAFDKFVEIGRVVMLKEGPLAGEIAVILEVIDLNRILVQGPKVPRQALLIRRSMLTGIKTATPRGARTKTLTKFWNEENVEAQWAETAMAKNLASQKIRKNLTDFDRFKVMLAQKKVPLETKVSRLHVLTPSHL